MRLFIALVLAVPALILLVAPAWVTGSSRLPAPEAPASLSDWSRQTTHTSADLHGVQFLNEQIGYGVGAGGTLLFTTVGGQDWVQLPTDTSDRVEAVNFSDSTHGWIAGANGLLRLTTDGGGTWKHYPTLLPTDLHTLAFSAPDRGWAGGDEGAIYRYDGVEWTPLALPGSPDVADLVFVDAQQGWAAADGAIYHTTNGGDSWTTQIISTAEHIDDITFANANEGWAVGSDGVIMHTTNGGGLWTLQSSGVQTDLHGIAFAEYSQPATAGTGWAVGDGGVVLQTTNAGDHWQADNSGTGFDLHAIAFPALGQAWVAGDAGTLLHWSNPIPTPTPTPTATLTPTPSPTATPTPTPTPIHTATPTSRPPMGGIRLQVFQDRNGNGQHDGLDLPWSGMFITLRDAQNLIRGTATSAEDGFVTFASLAPGAYTLWAVFPPGYVPTTSHPVVVQVAADVEKPAELGLAPAVRILHFMPLIHQP